MTTPAQPTWQTLPVPEQHATLKEIQYSKTTSPHSLKPYGVIRVWFKSKEAMLQFSNDPFKALGAFWTVKMDQQEVEAVFFDPSVNQHAQIDEAILLFKKLKLLM